MKGEHNTMKRKAVRNIYIDMVKPVEEATKAYKAGKMTFSEYLETVLEQYKLCYWEPYNIATAGTITKREADLIYERFEQFVKKEIKNACKA